MTNGIFCYTNIFCTLVKTHLMTVYGQITGMTINLYIWAFCSLVVMSYFMQSFGLAENFGCFQLAGIVGTIGLFEIFGNVMKNVMDFDGDRHISYYLTLPTKSWVIFASFVCFYTLMGVLLTFLVLPFGLAILYNIFDFAQVDWIRTFVIILLSNIFFSVSTLVITAHIPTISKVRNVWARFIFPLWFLGGFQFSWEVVYKISAPIAYVLLLNPIVFVMEGCRAALLGQSGFLPWGICCVALMGYTMLSWFYMRYKMKRLLDIV